MQYPELILSNDASLLLFPNLNFPLKQIVKGQGWMIMNSLASISR